MYYVVLLFINSVLTIVLGLCLFKLFGKAKLTPETYLLFAGMILGGAALLGFQSLIFVSLYLQNNPLR